ncbi:MAG: flavoprotein [Pseudonocardiales bacterium]|nr:flavoprotein [Pseudonocardiales bacterium]MBV9728481.1 flavoprotein [Pseudonocardiales bacterium]
MLYLVVCAAPPARHIDELVELLHQAGWHICVIPTPHAASWIDHQVLAQQTGHPIRHDHRLPGDPDSLPRADAIAVVPATFNTINKWAAGISDTFALGILNEAIGLKLPITIAPYAKPSLAAHPEFDKNLEKLAKWGVKVLPNEVIRVRAEAQDTEMEGDDKPALHFSWRPVVEAVARNL